MNKAHASAFLQQKLKAAEDRLAAATTNHRVAQQELQVANTEHQALVHLQKANEVFVPAVVPSIEHEVAALVATGCLLVVSFIALAFALSIFAFGLPMPGRSRADDWWIITAVAVLVIGSVCASYQSIGEAVLRVAKHLQPQ